MDYVPIMIAIISFVISVGSMLFFIGKWTGTQDYIHKEVGELKGDFKFIQTSLEEIRKEAKDDRHEFSRFIQTRQEDFWKELNVRLEKFEERWQIKFDKLEEKQNAKLNKKEDKS